MLDEVSVTKARRSIRDSGVRAEALCALVLIDSESEGDHQSQRLKKRRSLELVEGRCV